MTYVPTTATLAITNVGEGQVVTTAKMANTTTAGTDYYTTTAGQNVPALSGDVDLYSATKVTVNGTGVEATDGTNTITTGSKYFAIGTELTIDDASFTGAVVSNETGVKHGDSKASFEVTGDDDWNVYGAYQVTLTDVTAKYGSTEIASGDFVDAATALTLAAESGKGTAVLEKDDLYADAQATSTTRTGDVEYVAAVKVTLLADAGTTRTIQKLYFEDVSGQEPTIKSGSTTDQEVYVQVGMTDLQVLGQNQTAGKTIEISGATAKNSTTATASTYAWATFDVGTDNITLKEV